uniref:Uncharacterized protein n=1 Tax=Cacopsylla melanoneura TaxID=428564 RepID=A0A8D8WKF2_9HEMI
MFKFVFIFTEIIRPIVISEDNENSKTGNNKDSTHRSTEANSTRNVNETTDKEEDVDPLNVAVENMVVDVKIENIVEEIRDDFVPETNELMTRTEIKLEVEDKQTAAQDVKDNILKTVDKIMAKKADARDCGSSSSESMLSMAKLEQNIISADMTSLPSQSNVKSEAKDIATSFIIVKDERHSRKLRSASSSSNPHRQDVKIEANLKNVKTETGRPSGAANNPAGVASDKKPKIYLKEEFLLKSKELIHNECKNKSGEYNPAKIKCIHCNHIMDVNMDCILYHCRTCETIVRDQDEAADESKYLCFACKVYVFDNTGWKTHIKKHISTHLKRMNLYEPGHTWY